MGLDLAVAVACRSSFALADTLRSNRPLLGREPLEALPGGEEVLLLVGESNSCFRLQALARLPSVIRLGSSKGLAGHLPVQSQGESCWVRYGFLVDPHSDRMHTALSRLIEDVKVLWLIDVPFVH